MRNNAQCLLLTAMPRRGEVMYEEKNEYSSAEISEYFRNKSRAEEKLNKLTKREREVLFYIVQGSANKEIAYKLGISQRTVENHRFRIMDKTGCKSLPSLVGLVTLGALECLPHCSFAGHCCRPNGECRLKNFLGAH